MNKKATNVYRRCPNCPHHTQPKKCCCQPQPKSILRTSRHKFDCNTRPHSSIRTNAHNSAHTRPHDSINETLRLPSGRIESSMLLEENNALRRELLNVSSFLKDDATQLTTLNTNPHNVSTSLCCRDTSTLSQRLFHSNKALQQATLQLDALSKENLALRLHDDQLLLELQKIHNSVESLTHERDKLKHKLKKSSKATHNRTGLDSGQLQAINEQLRQEITHLRYEAKAKKEEQQQQQQQHRYKDEHASPNWIAHTSSKLNQHAHIYEHSFQSNHSEGVELLYALKTSICLAINCIHEQTRKFQTAFDNMGDMKEQSVQQLVAGLLESVAESVYSSYLLIGKEITRKLASHEKRVDNLSARLQNMLISIRNKHLKTTEPALLVREKPYKEAREVRSPLTNLTNRIF